MIIRRLTTIKGLLENWEFILSGLRVIEEKNHEVFDDEVFFKTCSFLAKRPETGYVGVVLDDSEQPVCFGVVQDTTPLYTKQRSFTVLAVYHNSAHQGATLELMQHFENWAKTQGIDSYTVQTRRPSGAAIRCFERKYGFKRGHITFEKKL